MPTPGVFAPSVRNQLKKKEIVKAAEPSVRKRIEREDLREFSGGREDSGTPKGSGGLTTKEA